MRELWKSRGSRLTFARSLFSERNISHFLSPFNSCKSSGRCSAFSKNLDTSPDLPIKAFLRDASKVIGSLELSTKAGFHIVALDCCSLSVPLPILVEVPFFVELL